MAKRASSALPESEHDTSEPQPAVEPSSYGDNKLKTNSHSFVETVVAPPNGLSFASTLWLAFLFRIVLLMFSFWQDATRWPDNQLRFTDVDYDVFTDAAIAIVNGTNPYTARPTYRYSPLIALLVAPGHWLLSTPVVVTAAADRDDGLSWAVDLLNDLRPHLARVWGKFLFLSSDLICAWLQSRVISAEVRMKAFPDTLASFVEHLAPLWITFTWLFNPVTAVVSVRGNAEALIGSCILACLLSVVYTRPLTAGLLFGLAVHLKLYPIIYGPAIYLWFTHHSSKPSDSTLIRLLPRPLHWQFLLASLLSLASLTAWTYWQFGGMIALNQAYLYHFTRFDIKHNFAPHFYPLYLLASRHDEATAEPSSGVHAFASHAPQWLNDLIGWQPSDDSVWTSFFSRTSALGLFNLASLLPSVVLLLGLSFKLYRHPGLCWFALTYAFVTFNKVCTSQYFLWSLVLLPPILPSLSGKLTPSRPNNLTIRWHFLPLIMAWFVGQALWLGAAYRLEMTNQSELMNRFTWPLTWLASLVFFSINIVILHRLMSWRSDHTAHAVVDRHLKVH